MAAKHRLTLRLGAALLLAAVLFAGCGERNASAGQAGGKAAVNTSGKAAANAGAARTGLPVSTWFPIQVGDKTLQLQLAITPAEQAQGLMGRKSLETDHGMLFVFDRGRQQSFWMANTPLPLDIGYFDNEGILREVYPLYPFDRTSVVSQRSDIRYALEMSQGWFSANGVRPGARLNLQELDAALKQRK